MSLKEAYSLAHTAQCRLQIAASRPERNLRFVVGHLMHYEHLRLRIVEIEHDISKSERAQAVAFKGTGHVGGSSLRHKPSTGQLGRRSPPPPVRVTEDEVEGDDDDFDAGVDDDDEDAGLGLMRFPSGTARPPQPPPELEPDDGEDEDEDEPVSPEEPDQATIEAAIRGQESADLAKMYEGVRRCPCHGKTDSPSITRMWELPASEQNGKNPGVTFAVAEVAVTA
ncbi:hypothetical protein LTR78_002865 [Recurvomyces mirabilis]|uniref:Uncharacterized protein n=1 Tax=Recurvomyces mirabilis TaxID=574656 RepID=A0AAE0WT59_9PEZI|nr:hypothetical protein LTR78_002865 [Recurvomyces mirabilis]KAK5159402.1 hypothetical protein LTS14_002544 [Recurvomyces mirabilis]